MAVISQSKLWKFYNQDVKEFETSNFHLAVIFHRVTSGVYMQATETSSTGLLNVCLANKQRNHGLWSKTGQ